MGTHAPGHTGTWVHGDTDSRIHRALGQWKNPNPPGFVPMEAPPYPPPLTQFPPSPQAGRQGAGVCCLATPPSSLMSYPFTPIGCFPLLASPHWLPGRARARMRKCRGRSGGGDGEGRGGGVEAESRSERWEWEFIPINQRKLGIFWFKYPSYAWV